MVLKQIEYIDKNPESLSELSYDSFIGIHSKVPTLHNEDLARFEETLILISSTFNKLQQNLKKFYSKDNLEAYMNDFFESNGISKENEGKRDFNDFLKILNDNKHSYIHSEHNTISSLMSETGYRAYFDNCSQIFKVSREYIFDN